MIRLLRCIKKRDDISDIEFRRHWDDARYRDIFSGYLNVSEGISYQMNLVLKIDINDEIEKTRGTQEAYDGVIELFWPNAKAASAMMQTPEGQALVEQLADYESAFVDFSRSSISITESN